MKRCIAFTTCIVILFCMSACASEAQRQFEADAESYFESYADSHDGVKTKKTVNYRENGSYAIEMPVTNSPADKEIKEYCDGLVEFFDSGATATDTLFVSYRHHNANDDVGSVEIFSRDTLGGIVTEQRCVFHYDKKSDTPVTDDLKTAVCAHARARLVLDGKQVDDDMADDMEMLFTKDGIKASFDENMQTTVDYESLRPTLPKGIKDTLPETYVRVIDPSKKLVAITYDDGPSKFTDDILDILEKNGSVATFFELGQLMSTQEDALKRMDALGCEIGSHTWSHKNLTKLSDTEFSEQIDRTADELYGIIGKKPSLVRPPYGAVNKSVREKCEYPLIGWSVDTLDWQSRNADKIMDTIKSEESLDGQIILMHSLYESSVEATQELVPWLIDNGYQLVTVSELFAYKYGQRPQNGKYYTATYFVN